MPFETAELRLPEGSRLVLCADGLIVGRDRDIGVGLELLREALARPVRTPEETCRAVLEALPPPVRATASPCWSRAPAFSLPGRRPTGTCPARPRPSAGSVCCATAP
ncbi:hypothetical protein BJY54_000891 [Streptomyces nodosus]|uniref:SpoIIE family protein phosphatase n=1 Tax=Streptomyces nodosus TaxID=40318 RepID=UPI000A69AF80|nr:hypothetical protein [Streptomyces nodosus]